MTRCLLREYSADDAPRLHKILSDPVTMCFWPEPFSLGQTESRINRGMKSYLNNGFGRWTAETRSAEVLIRGAGIMISGVNEKIENGLGYIIRSSFWNNGYVTEAAAVILCVELDSIDLSRIVANIPHDHSSSAGVAKKTVMKKEFEFINKRNRDILTYLYAINKD